MPLGTEVGLRPGHVGGWINTSTAYAIHKGLELRLHDFTVDRQIAVNLDWYSCRCIRQQFDVRRQLYQSKFTAICLSTVKSCRRNPRALSHAVDVLTQPPTQVTSEQLSADHFVRFSGAKSTVFGRPLLPPIRQSLSLETCLL